MDNIISRYLGVGGGIELTIDIIKFLLLVIVTFFTCQIVSDGKKRVSYIGVLIICFCSSVVKFINEGVIEAVIFGELIFISINKIINKSKFKVGFVILSIISAIGLIIFGRYMLLFTNPNSSTSSLMLLYPIGLFIGICYIFKDKTEHSKFIIPTVLISIVELILIVSNIKISFLPKNILIFLFNLLQNYMIIYIFSRVNEKLFTLTKSAYITLICLLFYMFLPAPSDISKLQLNLLYWIFVLKTFIILNYTDKRFLRLASWAFTVVCLYDFAQSVIVKFV